MILLKCITNAKQSPITIHSPTSGVAKSYCLCCLGVISLLTAGKSLLEIRQWYFKMKEEVFSSPRAGLPFNTRALEKLLQDELGTEMCMSDVKQPK